MHWTKKGHRKTQDILGVVRQSVRVAMTFPGMAAEHLYLYGARRRFDIWGEEWTGECEGVYIEDPRYPDYPAYFVVPIALYQQTIACYDLALLSGPASRTRRRRKPSIPASRTRRRGRWFHLKKNWKGARRSHRRYSRASSR